MAEDVEEVEGQAQVPIVINGIEYASLEEAQAKLEEKAKASDLKFREAADLRKEAAERFEEIERRKTESERPHPPQGNGTPPDPSVDPDGWLEHKLQNRMSNYEKMMQQLGGYVRTMHSDLQQLKAGSTGIDTAAVKRYVEDKYAHNPVLKSAILSDTTAMKEAYQAMQAEAHSDDLTRLQTEREQRKQQTTTQSGAAGAGSREARIPTAEEINGYSNAEFAKFEKRLEEDPAFRKAVMGQT